jgi:hypothetical protein
MTTIPTIPCRTTTLPLFNSKILHRNLPFFGHAGVIFAGISKKSDSGARETAARRATSAAGFLFPDIFVVRK